MPRRLERKKFSVATSREWDVIVTALRGPIGDKLICPFFLRGCQM